MSSIGDRIRRARQDKGISQEELARLIDTTKSTISKYELDRREPRLETLQQISDALGVSIIELLDPSIFDSLSSMLHVEPAHLLELMSAPVPEAADLRRTISDAAFNLESLRRVDSAVNQLKRQADENRSQLNAAFDKLNLSGQEKAVERVEELTEIPKYLRDAETPSEAPGGPTETE